MYHIGETGKSFEQASADGEVAVKRNGFGVLHVHDLGITLRGKGIAFDEQFGLIKPMKMLSALSQDPALTQIAKQVEDKTIAMVDEAGGSSPVRSAMPMHG